MRRQDLETLIDSGVASEQFSGRVGDDCCEDEVYSQVRWQPGAGQHACRGSAGAWAAECTPAPVQAVQHALRTCKIGRRLSSLEFCDDSAPRRLLLAQIVPFSLPGSHQRGPLGSQQGSYTEGSVQYHGVVVQVSHPCPP